MGVQIGELIPRKEIELESLYGKKVAIDAFNAMYQFLSTIRQRDGTPLMDSQAGSLLTSAASSTEPST